MVFCRCKTRVNMFLCVSLSVAILSASTLSNRTNTDQNLLRSAGNPTSYTTI
ncbi:hypothetical protein HanRHA438_Chr09g0428951 [Helianthus annuus]|nr:hypothetical protein HanRHA438_Chr09g0428951 [Helianthus annuus]